MRLCFVGIGYVGLVSSTILASLGHDVTCIDNDTHKISSLKLGKLPIYERDLDMYLDLATSAGKIRFEKEYVSDRYDALFIAVGTPSLESGGVNLQYVREAVFNAARNCDSSTLIIIKSTVPPETCKKLTSELRDMGYSHEIASNPEFLREGSATADFLHPDRIVIGTLSDKAKEILRHIYASLISRGISLFSTDPTTAEFIKYASNAFLATKIAFINEIANLCEKVGSNIDDLARGIGSDSRIGEKFLKAGPGFGGSCFPKDILGLSSVATRYDVQCHLIDAVIESNNARRQYIANKIKNVFGDINKKTICIFGITFKANTDDVRSSPAVDIARILLSYGAIVNIYDPEGNDNASKELPDAHFMNTGIEAARSADCVVILTEWDEFRHLDLNVIGNVMNRRLLFDFRRIIDKQRAIDNNFEYFAIGAL